MAVKMISPRGLLALSSIIEVGLARSFSTNCTLPTEGSRYVSSANVRSTMDIVWSCLFVLITCTWTVQHLKVSDLYEPRTDKSRRDRVRDVYNEIGRALYYMILTMLVPELLLCDAWTANIRARREERLTRELIVSKGDGDAAAAARWTRTHAYFTLMRGFWMRYRPSEASTSAEDHGKSEEAEEARELLFVLERGAFYQAYLMGVIGLPAVSADEINDKSKGDLLVKGAAVLQVVWLIVQVCVRVAQPDMATTQLEVAIVAFAVCTFITYLLQWGKPQNVRVPMYVTARQRLSREQLDLLKEASTINMPTEIRIPLPFGRSVEFDADTWAFAMGGLCFGAIHLLAWNFRFPTPVERLLWRIAAIASTALPTLRLLAHGDSKWEDVSLGVLLTVYSIIRLYLIVEMFRALAYLPPEAFKTLEWSEVFPHFS